MVRKTTKFLTILLGFTCLCLVSASALAHGERPHARVVVLDPQDPTFMFVTTNVFGHYINATGMDQPAFICQDVSAPVDDLTGPTGAALIPLEPGRRLILTSPRGVLLSTDDGCSWSNATDAIAQQRVSALMADPADPHHLLATTRDGSASNGVMESTDGGITWRATTLWGDYFVHDVFIDPASGRQYATGRRRSDDAFLLFERAANDTAWSETQLDPVASGIAYNSGTYQIMAVDPMDPLRVFLRARQDEGDVLLRRDNNLFTVVDESRRPTYFEALALIDGQWVLGRNVIGARISADGGDTWTTLTNAPPLHCFLHDGNRWLGCTGVVGGAATVVALEDATTQQWLPALRYEEICEPYACSMDREGGRCTDAGWDYQITEFREWGVLQDICGQWPEPPPPELDFGITEPPDVLEDMEDVGAEVDMEDVGAMVDMEDTTTIMESAQHDAAMPDLVVMSPPPIMDDRQGDGCQLNAMRRRPANIGCLLLMLLVLGACRVHNTSRPTT